MSDQTDINQTDLPPIPHSPETAIASEMVDTSSALRCYVVMGLAIPLSVGLVPGIAAFAMVGTIISAIWAYRLRADKAPEGLIANHGSWMVRTFWISSLFFLIAIILSSSLVSANADPESAIAMNKAILAVPKNEVDIANALRNFQEVNKTLVLVASLVCFLPPIIFVVVRCFNGYQRAYAGLPVENLKSWLLK